MENEKDRVQQKKKILVVDDEPNVLVTYKLILQQQGFEVVAAISSEEAKRALETTEFNLLLCDLSLEKQVSGFDVIELARVVQPNVTPVLLTGYASQEANETAEQKGIPVLFKPIDIQQLLETISALTRKQDAVRQASSK